MNQTAVWNVKYILHLIWGGKGFVAKYRQNSLVIVLSKLKQTDKKRCCFPGNLIHVNTISKCTYQRTLWIGTTPSKDFCLLLADYNEFLLLVNNSCVLKWNFVYAISHRLVVFQQINIFHDVIVSYYVSLPKMSAGVQLFHIHGGYVCWTSWNVWSRCKHCNLKHKNSLPEKILKSTACHLEKGNLTNKIIVNSRFPKWLKGIFASLPYLSLVVNWRAGSLIQGKPILIWIFIKKLFKEHRKRNTITILLTHFTEVFELLLKLSKLHKIFSYFDILLCIF